MTKKKIKIYHNPRCSKSRQTLQLIEEHGFEPEIVHYLEDVPTEKDLKTILKKLGLKPTDILRKGEAVYKEKYKGLALSDAEWIEAMMTYPKLIERPIVVVGNKAVLGRPPENVLDII